MNRRRILGLALAALSLIGASCNRDPNVLKFGLVLPMSGEAQIYAESIKKGIDVAVEQIRTNPAFTKQIELMMRDSEGDPEVAAAKMAELYDEGAIAVIGAVTSDEAEKMVQVADRYDRVLLSPSASSPELTGISRNFFRVFPSDFVEGTKMGNFAALQLKVPTVAIMATISPYGRGIQEVFASEYERQGGQIVGEQEFPRNTGDLSGIVDWALSLEPMPEGIYIAAYWDEIARLIKGLRGGGYKGRILTTAAFATPQALAVAGEAAEGVIFTQTVFDIEDSAEPLRGFVTSYRAKYNEDPDLYAAHGYDAMLVLVEAQKRAKGSMASDYYKGMIDIRGLPGVTGSLQFNEKGDVTKFPRVYLIRDGVAQLYDEVVREQREAIQERLRRLEEERRRLQKG